MPIEKGYKNVLFVGPQRSQSNMFYMSALHLISKRLHFYRYLKSIIDEDIYTDFVHGSVLIRLCLV